MSTLQTLKTHRSVRLAAALLLVGACATSAPTPGPAPERAAAATNAGPKHMLFRARGPNGATVYLLGSVHLLSPDIAKLPDVVDSAFAHAKVIAFEASLDTIQLRAMEMVAHARYPAGTTLRSSLSAPAIAHLDSVLKGYGMTVDQVNQFKPWFVSLFTMQLVMQRMKFDAQYGVDMQLNARAHTAGKPIVGLETVDFQMNLFDSISPADQEKMILQSTGPDSTVVELTKVKDAWVTGNVVALDRLLNKSLAESPTLFATMVTDRNRSWIPKIDSLLKGKDDALVVFGAAHLVGTQGVVALLRAKGYTVEQL